MLREDLSAVASQFPAGEGVAKLMKCYKYSLNYYAVQRWQTGDTPQHGLLNFTSLKRRFQKSDTQLEKNRQRNGRELKRAIAAKRKRCVFMIVLQFQEEKCSISFSYGSTDLRLYTSTKLKIVNYWFYSLKHKKQNLSLYNI